MSYLTFPIPTKINVLSFKQSNFCQGEEVVTFTPFPPPPNFDAMSLFPLVKYMQCISWIKVPSSCLTFNLALLLFATIVLCSTYLYIDLAVKVCTLYTVHCTC